MPSRLLAAFSADREGGKKTHGEEENEKTGDEEERAGRRAEYAEGESKNQTPRSPMRAPRPAKAKSSRHAQRPPRAPTRAQNPNGNACQERLIHSKSSACFRSKDADRGRNLLPRRRAMRIAILVISSMPPRILGEAPAKRITRLPVAVVHLIRAPKRHRTCMLNATCAHRLLDRRWAHACYEATEGAGCRYPRSRRAFSLASVSAGMRSATVFLRATLGVSSRRASS